MILAEIFFIYFYQRGLQPQKAGSSKMNTALEYSTRVVQEGGRRCKKSSTPDPSKNTFNEPAKSAYFTVRGQSYFSRLPKYWPPIPLSARRVCPPPATKAHTRQAERGLEKKFFYWWHNPFKGFSFFFFSLYAQSSCMSGCRSSRKSDGVLGVLSETVGRYAVWWRRREKRGSSMAPQGHTTHNHTRLAPLRSSVLIVCFERSGNIFDCSLLFHLLLSFAFNSVLWVALMTSHCRGLIYSTYCRPKDGCCCFDLDFCSVDR